MTSHLPVVIVEDEVKIAAVLRDYLHDYGYETHILAHGDEVMPWLEENGARLVLLDLMLPGTDGLSLCRQIRQSEDASLASLPVVMLTARVEEVDRLLGLELGADDYICKPFSGREVCARVRALLRRSEGLVGAIDENKLILDMSRLRVVMGETKLELTLVEFKLLKALYERQGHILSRNQLMACIYDDHRIVSDRTIDSHIKKLRKKINVLFPEENPIHSVYGVGYKFD